MLPTALITVIIVVVTIRRERFKFLLDFFAQKLLSPESGNLCDGYFERKLFF